MNCKILSLITFLGINLCNSVYSGPSTHQRMNVVLITADDLGLQLGCYGDPRAITPRINRFAAEGALFTRAHVTQASCSASRSSLLTGWYPHESGQVGLSNRGYSTVGKIESLPSLLKEAGYYTGIIGKLHVSPPEKFPFDYFEVDHKPTRKQSQLQIILDEFLGQAEDRPFFLMLNFYDPHFPYEAQSEGLPERLVKPDEIDPWGFQAGVDSPEIRQHIADYYSCVHRLDALMGKFLDKLYARGHRENTMILFLSDNGPPFARAKAAEYNLSTHVPFIVHWPGFTRPGMKRDQLVSGVDVFATVLDAANVTMPVRSVAKSIRPILHHDKALWRETVLTTFTAHTADHYYPRRSVTDGRFRLIWNLLGDYKNPLSTIDKDIAVKTSEETRFDGTKVREIFARFTKPPVYELYDVVNDPNCLHNLAGQDDVKEIFLHLRSELGDWLLQTNDPLLPPHGLETWTRLHRENNDPQWKDPKFLYPNR